MDITKIQEWDASLGKYASETNPTTQQQIISFLQNNNEVLQALTKLLWQPQRTVAIGSLTWTPNMNANTVAICKTSGTSGTTEPTWGNVGATVVDGSAIYEIYSWGNNNTSEIETLIANKENKNVCVPRTNNTSTTVPQTTSPALVLAMDNFAEGGTVRYSTLANLFANLTKAQITTALGYTPPTTNTTYTAGDNITLQGTTFSLTQENVVGALGYTPMGGTTIPNGICSTSKGTVAKVVAVSGAFSLSVGQMVYVKFANGNTASQPTLNINGSGAKPIREFSINTYGGASGYGKTLRNISDYRLLIYDGTNYNVVDITNAYHSSDSTGGGD